MREDPIAGYFDKKGSASKADMTSEVPQYKYSGGPINFGGQSLQFLNDIDWTKFNPATGSFDETPVEPEVEVEEVAPEVQYESVKQYDTKPQGFRYQEGKTPYEMVQQEVVPNVEDVPAAPTDYVSWGTLTPVEPNAVPLQPEQPYTTYPGGNATFGNTSAPAGGK